MKRRDVLSISLQVAGATVAGIVGVPLAMNALSPLFVDEADQLWRPLGELKKFPIGKIVPSVFVVDENTNVKTMNRKGVFVWRQSESDFVVYSRSCTDLGCPLNFDAGSEWFFCPCHGGIFDKEGSPKAGPPKEPMWRYATRIRDGVLEIDLRSVPPMV